MSFDNPRNFHTNHKSHLHFCIRDRLSENSTYFYEHMLLSLFYPLTVQMHIYSIPFLFYP